MKNEPQPHRRAGGFTLVELLVVIGIIALLLGILLPTLSRARQSANSIWCLSNLRQIGMGMLMYAQAHNDRLPIAYRNGDADPTGTGATDWAWLILPYLNGNAGDTYAAGEDPGGMWALYKDKDTVTGGLNASWYDAEKVQTYGVHPHLFRFAPGPLNPDMTYNAANAEPGPHDDGKVPYKLSQIERSSEMILVMDAVQFGDTLGPGSWASHADLWMIQGNGTSWCHNWATLSQAKSIWPQGPDAGFNSDYETVAAMFADTGPGDGAATMIRYRHLNNTQANALFADGHAGSFRYSRPGLGGSELRFDNFILNNMTLDLHFAGD